MARPANDARFDIPGQSDGEWYDPPLPRTAAEIALRAP